MYFSELEQMVKEVRENLDKIEETDYLIEVSGEVINGRVDLYFIDWEGFFKVKLIVE